MHVEKRHVELQLNRIVFPASESKGKEYPRVIYMNEVAFWVGHPFAPDASMYPRVIYMNEVALGVVTRLCENGPLAKSSGTTEECRGTGTLSVADSDDYEKR